MRSVERRPFKPQTALLPEGRPWARNANSERIPLEEVPAAKIVSDAPI